MALVVSPPGECYKREGAYITHLIITSTSGPTSERYFKNSEASVPIIPMTTVLKHGISYGLEVDLK